MSGHHGWALVFTDRQRELATQALTDKATQVEQAARNSGGNAHAVALRTAGEYAALASAFREIGPGTAGDVLVSMPRDRWAVLVGWVYGVTVGDEAFPAFVADFLAAVHKAAGIAVQS